MEKEIVVIYANEIMGIFTDDLLETIDMFDVEISRDVLFDFFIDECLEDYKNETDDKNGVTTEGYFEDWLHEFTADDTIGLWDYAKKRNADPLICRMWR